MSVVVHCQKCGAENRLGQLFCRECGTKLDLSNLKPGNTSSGKRRSAGSLTARVVRLVISLTLLVVLGLLCWPAKPHGDAPSENGAAIVQQKMSALRGAILRRNEASEIFIEADINAHLNARLIQEKRGGFHLEAREVRVDLKPDHVQVWLKSNLGPLPLTYTAIFNVLPGQGGQVNFKAGRVHIGRMQMPGPLRERILGQFAGLFASLQDEIVLLKRMSEIRVADGEGVASTFHQSSTHEEP